MSYPCEAIAALSPICGDHYHYFFNPDGSLTPHRGDFAREIELAGKHLHAALGRADSVNTHLILRCLPEGVHNFATYVYNYAPMNATGALMALVLLGHDPILLLGTLRKGS